MNEFIFVKLDTMTERERKRRRGLWRLPRREKRGRWMGMWLQKGVLLWIFMNATIKGFCRKVNDFNNRSVRINRPSKLERRTLMANACVMGEAIEQRSVWH
jgi:hypothetical protein